MARTPVGKKLYPCTCSAREHTFLRLSFVQPSGPSVRSVHFSDKMQEAKGLRHRNHLNEPLFRVFGFTTWQAGQWCHTYEKQDLYHNGINQAQVCCFLSKMWKIILRLPFIVHSQWKVLVHTKHEARRVP